MERASGPAPRPPRWWPVEFARALDAGRWRFITEPGSDLAPSARSAAESDLVVVQRIAAEIQRAFACVRLDLVRARLAEVESLLPLPLKTVVGGRTTPDPPPRPAKDGLPQLWWRAACDVWRERTELEELGTRFGRDGLALTDLLAGAYELESVWVSCDPWWAGSSPDDGVATRRLLLPWATALRRIHRATAAQVDAQALRRVGGERALHALAMRALADHGVRPWAGRSARAQHLPVRIPRQRACAAAARWLEDQSW